MQHSSNDTIFRPTLVFRIEAEIAQLEQTIMKLREGSHICTDAVRHLESLKQRLKYAR